MESLKDLKASWGLAQDVEDRISMLFLASYPFWVVARWGIGFPVLTGAMAC
jgi:hypothetical protein